MRILTIRPPVNRAQARLVDEYQAARVRLAIGIAVPISEVGLARVKGELEDQAAERGEEVQTWQ